MFDICRFSGNQMNVKNGRNLNFKTFRELSEHFLTCKQGAKNETYFVRGQLDPIYRVDANLETSNIFVIDGDGTHGDKEALGAPHPSLLHELLKSRSINHHIYTTYSHNPSIEKYKYRCIIEVEPHHKPELKQLAANIIGFCHVGGVPILHVKEMNTWSQPWFYPTRENPGDGMFETYSFCEGKAFKRDRQKTEAEVQTIQQSIASGERTVEQYCQMIRESETYHEPLMALSFQYISDGLNKTLAVQTLKTIMYSAKTQDARWLERFNSIEGLVDGALARLGTKKERMEAEEDGECSLDIVEEDRPSRDMVPTIRMPGLMGELFDYAFSCQYVPSQIMAHVSTIGLIAGICGRKFNVSSTGLNVELLVIARTGRGKDSIRRFITQTLYNLNENGTASSFLAPSRFTGPVAMYNALVATRSCVSIQTECGLIKSSDAGDAAGIVRYQLGLYSASGKHEVMGAEGYSSKDNSIQALNAAAMTFIMESTAESFAPIFTSEKALASGELPRVGIYRESDYIPEGNELAGKLAMPTAVHDRLKHLTTMCSREQATATPDVIDLEFENPNSVLKIKERWRRILNEETDLRMLMATRNALRTFKYAAIAAVFNNEPGDHVIHERELAWASEVVEAEFASITNFFKATELQGDMYDLAKRLKIKVIDSFNGRASGVRQCPLSLSKQRLMPRAVFKAICDNIPAIKALGDKRTGKDGSQKMLDYLLANDCCKKPTNHLNPDSNRMVKCIKFVREFDTL
mgnify:FL=1